MEKFLLIRVLLVSYISAAESFSLPATRSFHDIPLTVSSQSAPQQQRLHSLPAFLSGGNTKGKNERPLTLIRAKKSPVDGPDESGWGGEDLVEEDNNPADADVDVDAKAEVKGDVVDVVGDDDDDDDIDYEMYEEEEEELYEDDDIDEGLFFSTENPKDKIDEDWDEEDSIEYPLQDDPDDPNYQKQKELVEAAMKEPRIRMDQLEEFDFVMNNITDEQAQQLDDYPLMKEEEERTKDLYLTDQDLDDTNIDFSDLEKAVANVSDIMEDDPYEYHQPGEENLLEQTNGISDDLMGQLDQSYKDIQRITTEEPWNKLVVKEMEGIDHLDNQTTYEIDECLQEIGGSSYNVTRWLWYDLDFNVSNLILCAIKHNPKAPIIFQHWYPQLVTYERYQHARDRDFDFTWEEVENADMSELEKYYLGFGYSEIPEKAPAETGIISVEDLDEEEIKMAAFESWMIEVYNSEWDRKDFDDDDFRDEDNAFSNFYEAPKHPDEPKYDEVEDDLKEWREEMGDDPEVREYRDDIATDTNYTIVEDEEFTKEFRGHLVVACTGFDVDLEIAETITRRMKEEFGKQVYVETRVIAHAREEDNVFEVWLESYNVDLLHSKKRATTSTKGWIGPALCDNTQVEYLVNQVRYLISDDVRYSYRMFFDEEADALAPSV